MPPRPKSAPPTDSTASTPEGRLDELTARALQGGGEARIEKQHEAGKLTARERLEHLLDQGSFVETGRFVTHRAAEFDMQDHKILGDGVITGYGKIAGRHRNRY